MIRNKENDRKKDKKRGERLSWGGEAGRTGLGERSGEIRCGRYIEFQ